MILLMSKVSRKPLRPRSRSMPDRLWVMGHPAGTPRCGNIWPRGIKCPLAKC